MAGSHEVRGSNPLFSTMNSIAGRTIGQRFFYSQVKGKGFEPREGSMAALYLAGANGDLLGGAGFWGEACTVALPIRLPSHLGIDSLQAAAVPHYGLR